MAKVIEVNIKKTHEWGEHEGEEYVITPNSIPEARSETSDFVSKLFPTCDIVEMGRTEHFGKSTTYSLFFKTLQDCFNKHLPFAIRPEVLWYLIIHEVATAVKLNPERYRLHFIASEQKETIEVLAGESFPGNWVPFISRFADQIKDQMLSDLGDLLRPEFTTSTVESDMATAIAFMEAASPYYDYRMRLCCGLPLIRLDGEAKDYAEIVERAKVLKTIFGKDLGQYFTHLIPVLTTIAEQAAGAPVDNTFWGSIYNHDSGSGGSDGTDDLGGWITTFVNYVRRLEDENEDDWGCGKCFVNIKPKPDHVYDWTTGKRWLVVGMVPNHVSSADFVLEKDGNKVSMKFIGGVLGVDIDDGFVSPQLSYAVLSEKSDADALAKMK